LAATDTQATDRSRAAHGIAALCTNAPHHPPVPKKKNVQVYTAAVVLIDYIYAPPEEEAVEVGDGEVRRAVTEPEAPPRLQTQNQMPVVTASVINRSRN
jgi:hypothetical protein